MNLDETNKKLDELMIRASYRFINDIGEKMDDILKDCLDDDENKDYNYLIRLKHQLEQEEKEKQMWKEIKDLEEQAEQAYREVTEWGYYLEALSNSDIESHSRLMSLYDKVNHKTYWRK